MIESSSPGYTNVLGYYNGSPYPIQLVVSELNAVLHLKKGDFILDRNHNKVNDPFFECFVKNKQLAREVSEKSVPINAIPRPGAMAPVARSTNPVQTASSFKVDRAGVRQPVMQPTTPAKIPNTDVNPVRPMSMEEARRLGFVRKVREVPEDYGVTDTDGVPPRTPPPMRIAIDPSMNKVPRALPKELISNLDGVADPGTRTSLITQLTQAPTPQPLTEGVEPENFFHAGSVTQAVPAASPIISGAPTKFVPAQVPPTPASAAARLLAGKVNVPTVFPARTVAPKPEPAPAPELPAAEQELDDVLPPPDLDSEQAEHEDSVESAVLQEVKARIVPPKSSYACPVCSADHKLRSLMLKHVKKAHPDMYATILQQYPVD